MTEMKADSNIVFSQNEELLATETNKRNMRILDDFLHGVDFEITASLKELQLEFIGMVEAPVQNFEDLKKEQKKIRKRFIDFGCNDQVLKIVKEDESMKVTFQGWRFGVYDETEQIYFALLKA